MIATSKGVTVPTWVGLGFRVLPLPIADMALRRLMLGIVGSHPESFARMGSYASVTFLIEPTDLPIQFRVRLDSPTPIVCQRRPAACIWDARVAGPITPLLAMVHGVLDGDALFFSREITIEGDTDAILAMRNAIDAAEIDLSCELANLFGPFSPVARQAVKVAMPIMGRLFNIATASRGVHAT